MRKLTLFAMVIIAGFMVSCGSGIPNERDVTVSNVEITGFIKDYLKVVDGSYKFTQDGNNAFITIKLELIGKPTNYSRKSFAHIRLTAIGENNEIFDNGEFEAEDSEFKKVEGLLEGNIGDTKNVSFKWRYFNLNRYKETSKSIFTKAVSFELIDNGFEISNAPEDNTETSKISSGSSKWDKILTDYESFVDKYISVIKKASTGDLRAINEMESLWDKAEKLESQLENASDELTVQQAARFSKISSKFAKAALDIY